MKKFYSLATLAFITSLLFTSAASAQATDDYRTVTSGNWNSLSTWERYSGATWQALTGVAPLTLPTSGDGAISIQNGHTVTVIANVTVDQVTIATGGQITVNNVTLTVDDGTGTDLTVNGILEVTGAAGGAVASTGGPQFAFNTGSVYKHSRNGGSIIVASGGGSTTTWNTNSTIEFSAGGTLSASTNNTTIGKISVSNNSNATITGGTLTVSNATGDDLSIASGSSLTIGTNGGITLANTAGITAAIDGTLTVNTGRTFNLGTSTSVTTVTGTVNNAETISNATAARLSFSSGSTYQHSQNGGTVPSATWNANSTCEVILTDPASGTGDWPAGIAGQTFGHFTLTTTGTGTNGYQIANSFSCAGNFTLNNGSSRPAILSSSGTARTITIGGNFSISAGTFDLSSSTGIGTLQVAGDFSAPAGTITETGTGSGAIVFTGTTNYSSTGTRFANTINFTANTGASLLLGANDFGLGSIGTFTLSSGATLGIGHASGITTTGTASNVRVTGTRTYNAGATYIYNGSATQITGAGLPATVAGLTFNNTSTGVTLSQSVAVSSLATFTDGIVSPGANTFTVNAGANATGASDASFVNGPMAKIGNTAFTFPVGKSGTGYQPVGISAISASTTFIAEYIRASGAAKGAANAPLQIVSACEHWMLYASSAVAADVTLYWNANSPCGSAGYINGPFPNPFLRIARYDGASGSTWSNASNTNSQDPANSVTSGNMTASLASAAFTNPTFFTFGTTNSANSPLPVMYANVKAYGKNSGVQVEWSNLTERELTGYDVERSANAINFTSINHQQPKNNLNDKADYTVFDAAPLQGTNYYRIKANEIGGKIIYSKILRVEIGNTTKLKFTMYPNPVTGNQVTVGLNNVKQGQYTLRVVNASGLDVFKQTITSQGSSMTETVQLPASVKPGVYTMLISGGDYRESKVFVIQ